MGGPPVTLVAGGIERALQSESLLIWLDAAQDGKLVTWDKSGTGPNDRRSFAQALQRPVPYSKFRLHLRKPEIINGEL